MSLPDAARGRLSEQVAWLTTVTRSGRPSPTPVWFVTDGADIVVYSEPTSYKVGNIERQPGVTLHFNSDPDGRDIVVLHAEAVVEPGQRPSRQPGFVEKYTSGIEQLGLSLDELDAAYSTRIRLRPRRVWLGPS